MPAAGDRRAGVPSSTTAPTSTCSAGARGTSSTGLTTRCWRNSRTADAGDRQIGAVAALTGAFSGRPRPGRGRRCERVGVRVLGAGTVRIDHRSNCLMPPSLRGTAVAWTVLDLVDPLYLLAISSESPTTSTSLAPSSLRSRGRAGGRDTRRRCWWPGRQLGRSARTSPRGALITQAAAAGPGLPRAPPSTWTISFIVAGLCRERREGPDRPAPPPRTLGRAGAGRRHARPAAVANDPPLGAVAAAAPPRGRGGRTRAGRRSW